MRLNARIVFVRDLMQRNYCYERSEPEGTHFAPDFHPELTPAEMLALGVFGGRYMTDCTEEFPEKWFVSARMCPQRHDPALNYFGILASLPLSVWRARGWIYHEDPRGWFQWYCRYYSGRRSIDDRRQIGRFLAMTRHVAQVRKNCTPGDSLCRARQKQALLQWGYDSRKL